MVVKFSSRQSLVRFLHEQQIRLVKERGQNLLLDEDAVSRIVSLAFLQCEDEVLEIGGGLGHLSRGILARPLRSLIIFEVDRKLALLLQEMFRGDSRVRVVCCDALKADWSEYFSQSTGKRFVISNLPYSVSSALLLKSLHYTAQVEKFVFTVQKDFALRVLAKESQREYGALSVLIQCYTKPQMHFKISPHAFFPQPHVVSVSLSLDSQRNYVPIKDSDLFAAVLCAAFQQRRKNLLKRISQDLGVGAADLFAVFQELDIPYNIRGEDLSPKQFITLANALTKHHTPSKKINCKHE